jgi:lipopolysaccharide transport system permease protein
LGVLNARFADSGQIVASLVGVLFYITPILWMPSALASSDAENLVLDFNPIYQLLQVVRQPLFGELPTLTNYFVCLTTLVIGLFVSKFVNQSYLKKVSLWV